MLIYLFKFSKLTLSAILNSRIKQKIGNKKILTVKFFFHCPSCSDGNGEDEFFESYHPILQTKKLKRKRKEVLLENNDRIQVKIKEWHLLAYSPRETA